MTHTGEPRIPDALFDRIREHKTQTERRRGRWLAVAWAGASLAMAGTAAAIFGKAVEWACRR